MSVYLDFNASSPIDERVLDYMIDVYRHSYGNADSRTHDFGNQARTIVEEARSQVAAILSVQKDEVFFTSGATESNNIALQGLRDYALATGKTHIITSAIEHKSVLETVKRMGQEGFKIDYVTPGLSGRVSASEILNLVREDTLLVSLMHVNNETGIVQPIQEVGEDLSNKEVFFHVDATQSFGKLVDELKSTKYNMLSMSAHKIGGPQGVGALILRKNRYKLPPVKGIMYGGQQEHGIRPGTVPVALVAGLGKACELNHIEYKENLKKCNDIKMALFNCLKKADINYEFNGDQEYCVPNAMNVCLHGVSSEALMLAAKQYCSVSNGSACNSNSYNPSFVLTAMGTPADQIDNSIRISWGPESDLEDTVNAFEDMLKVAKGLIF